MGRSTAHVASGARDQAMTSASSTIPTRDPAWVGRLFWMGAALVLLWPALVATEFKPWVLVHPDNVKPTTQFLGSFFPPTLGGEFLVAPLVDPPPIQHIRLVRGLWCRVLSIRTTKNVCTCSRSTLRLLAVSSWPSVWAASLT